MDRCLGVCLPVPPRLKRSTVGTKVTSLSPLYFKNSETRGPRSAFHTLPSARCGTSPFPADLRRSFSSNFPTGEGKKGRRGLLRYNSTVQEGTVLRKAFHWSAFPFPRRDPPVALTQGPPQSRLQPFFFLYFLFYTLIGLALHPMIPWKDPKSRRGSPKLFLARPCVSSRPVALAFPQLVSFFCWFLSQL